MKIFSLIALLASSSAFAAPSCWTVDGSEIGLNKDGTRIADGQFLISAEISRISKEDLLLVMQKVDFGNIKPAAYPSIIDDVILFHVKSITENTERMPLMEAVNGQVDEILAIPGVKGADCNGVTGAYRAPAIVGNPVE